MTVTYVRLCTHDKVGWALIDKNNESTWVKEDITTTGALLESHRAGLVSSGQPAPAYDETNLCSPITVPTQVICQGKNYSDHRVETGAGADKPAYNLIFTKASSSIAPACGNIRKPSHVRLLDYEIELGLVIGRPVSQETEINESNWTDYVAGLVIVNDISARDIQLTQGQWFKGKSYRTFCPIGPRLVVMDADDWSQFNQLTLTLSVNGDVRQQSTAENLLFHPWETLHELGQMMDLNPGDVIATGTPGGVALQAPPAIAQRLGSAIFSEERRMAMFVEGQAKRSEYLQVGDTVEATIRTPEGSIDLGQQELVVAEA